VANEAVAVAAAAAATVAATVAVAPAAEALDSYRAWLQRLQHYLHSAAKIVADVAGGVVDLSADCGPSVAGRARQYHWDWNGPILPDRQHLVLLQDDVDVAAAAVAAADDIAVAAVAAHSAAFGDLKIQNQGIGLVNISDSCSVFDGIAGFAFQELSMTKSVPVFQQMIDQHLVEQPIFSFHMKSGSSDGGLMILGGSNSSLYYGPLTYTNVTEAKYWTFKMDFIEVHGKNSRRCESGCKAIMDTGTSLIVGPVMDVLYLNKAIGAEHNDTYDLYIVDCATIPQLPIIVFSIADKEFYVKPQTYVIVYQDFCFSGFMDMRGLDHWIIGDVFLRENYVEFDWARKRLGIAPAV